MTDLDVETLRELGRDCAPETVNWYTVVSAWHIDPFCLPNYLRRSLPELVATREEVIREVQLRRSLSYSEASAVVNHAIDLGLIATADNGNLVYVPEDRGEQLW